MERIIRVTGKGNISVRPDTTRVLITLSEVFPSYEKAVEGSTEEKKHLTDDLGKLGFEKSDLKTTNFSVDPEYENYKDKDDCWKNRLVGYRYRHNIKLEFPIDNALLGKVFYTLAHCKSAPEFQVQYTIADPEPVKNKLLSKAVEDAKEKAAVIAEAAGVQLKEIVTIDYSWKELELISRTCDNRPLAGAMLKSSRMDSYDVDIEADDIQTSDTVTIVWAIA